MIQAVELKMKTKRPIQLDTRLASTFLDVALETVGEHYNGLGEGVLSTVDAELQPHSTWLRIFSHKPLLEVVTFVPPASKEVFNTRSNPYSEWMFASFDKRINVYLIGESAVIDDPQAVASIEASLEARSYLKQDNKRLPRPIAIKTTVDCLELSIPDQSILLQYGSLALTEYIEHVLETRKTTKVACDSDSRSRTGSLNGSPYITRKTKSPPQIASL